MYELWMLVYVCFFPAAYLGWLGVFGPEAKKAADRFFDFIGYAIVIIGIIMMIEFFTPIFIAYVQTFAAWIMGGK